MKKIIILLSVVLFLGLFFAFPYVLDYWQNKNALEAAGGMPVYEGALSTSFIQCQACKPYPICCTGGTLCAVSLPPACANYQMTVIQSAGGQTCPTGYLLNAAQYGIANGAQNLIFGGTTCTNLSVIASEKSCLGCTATINSPKVYAFKNKLKAFTDFIIAGFRSK